MDQRRFLRIGFSPTATAGIRYVELFWDAPLERGARRCPIALVC